MNKIDIAQKSIQQALLACELSGMSSIKVHLLRAMNELKKIEVKKSKRNKTKVEQQISKKHNADSLLAIEKMIESESSLRKTK